MFTGIQAVLVHFDYVIISALCNDPTFLEYPNVAFDGDVRFPAGDGNLTACQMLCMTNRCAGSVFNDAGEC